MVKHLKKDINVYKQEAEEDGELMKSLKKHKPAAKKVAKKSKKAKPYAKGPKAKHKIEKVMHEFKEGKLHSGSKHGPEVTNPKQAIAISLSEARKASKGKKKKSK